MFLIEERQRVIQGDRDFILDVTEKLQETREPVYPTQFFNEPQSFRPETYFRKRILETPPEISKSQAMLDEYQRREGEKHKGDGCGCGCK